MKNFVWIFLLLVQYLPAQVVQPLAYPILPQSVLFSRKQAEENSFLSNPVILSFIRAPAAGVFTERRFMLQELSLYQASVNIPLEAGGLGAGVHYMGNNGYKQSGASLAYGKSLGKLDMGIQFNYHSFNLAGYGKSSAFGSAISAGWQASEKIYTTLQLVNPVASRFGGKEKPAFLFSLTLGYEISSQLAFSLHLQKEQMQTAGFICGVYYEPDPRVKIKGGMSIGDFSPWFSLGYKWQQLRIDIAASRHFRLGITPALQVFFLFKNKEQ